MLSENSGYLISFNCVRFIKISINFQCYFKLISFFFIIDFLNVYSTFRAFMFN